MKETLDYSVGSVADLISGSTTPNKPKVVKKVVKNAPVTPPQAFEPEESNRKSSKKKGKKRSLSPMNKKQKSNTVETQNEEPPMESEIIPKKKSKKQKSPKMEQAKKEEESQEKQETNENEDKGESNEVEAEKIPKNPDHTTVFIGNLPLNVTHKKLEKILGKFGKVVNARIRSIPIADPKVPKKVAFIKKQFHAERKSMHGYVTFATPADAEKALTLNGTEYKSHHLRVNLCSEKLQPDKNRAIFLGNVSFAAEEEELWKLFESCGEIESVRLVRDRFTDIGKGFGYINFKSADSVELALQMGEVKLRDRVLRISLYNGKAPKKPKPQKGQKKDRKQKKGAAENGEEAHEGNDTQKKHLVTTAKHGQFQGKFAQAQKKKKFNKGNQQKKHLAKKVAPRTMSGTS